MTQHDSLIEKLDELDRLYAEAEQQMNDPAVASDPTRIVAVAKERARLGKIVEPYRAYTKLVTEQAEARGILDDPEADAEMRSLAQAELDELAGKANEALEVVKGLLVMSDDETIDSIMLEIRAGTGGDEAALFARDLLNMYRHYAEGRGWKFELLSSSGTEMGGFREVVVNVRGEGVWTHLGYEGGGHRVQRVPET
ncbi:hypothetical protein LCGC14_2121310, partial [marine sediment metagenome]